MYVILPPMMDFITKQLQNLKIEKKLIVKGGFCNLKILLEPLVLLIGQKSSSFKVEKIKVALAITETF